VSLESRRETSRCFLDYRSIHQQRLAAEAITRIPRNIEPDSHIERRQRKIQKAVKGVALMRIDKPNYAAQGDDPYGLGVHCG
jgi:hypothetical protein